MEATAFITHTSRGAEIDAYLLPRRIGNEQKYPSSQDPQSPKIHSRHKPETMTTTTTSLQPQNEGALDYAYGVSISTAADLHTISTGDTYQLTVDVAGRGDYISSGFQIQLTNSNLTPFASSNISDPVDDNTFRAVTLSYTVGTNSPFIGQGLRIRLINQAGSNQTNFDNVRLTFTPVSVP